MNQTAIPSPQKAVSALRSTLASVVNSLLKGATHARWYADTMDEKPDSALSPALVRKEAKRFLLKKGQDVKDEQEIDFEAEFLPNLGLAVNSGAFSIRVLRSDRGLLPIPGPSKKRQKFYAQQPSFNFDGEETAPDGDVVVAVVNLVLHWTTDAEYNLIKVYLACPETGGTTRASVTAHWDEPIWRRIDPTMADGEQVEAVASDLDIHLDGEAFGTKE